MTRIVIDINSIDWFKSVRLLCFKSVFHRHRSEKEVIFVIIFSVSKSAYLENLLTCKVTVVTTRYRSKFTLKSLNLATRLRLDLRLFWLRIINVLFLDRIIIKAWLDIIQFLVVIWSNQFRVRKHWQKKKTCFLNQSLDTTLPPFPPSHQEIPGSAIVQKISWKVCSLMIL